MAQTLEPQRVQVNSGGILIQWSDGHKSLYAPRALRLRCPCAQCIDEWTRELRLDPESVSLGLEAVDHIPVGNYAIQFLWSDAHYTGIYTHKLLRGLCACEICVLEEGAGTQAEV